MFHIQTSSLGFSRSQNIPTQNNQTSNSLNRKPFRNKTFKRQKYSNTKPFNRIHIQAHWKNLAFVRKHSITQNSFAKLAIIQRTVFHSFWRLWPSIHPPNSFYHLQGSFFLVHVFECKSWHCKTKVQTCNTKHATLIIQHLLLLLYPRGNERHKTRGKKTRNRIETNKHNSRSTWQASHS